MPQRNPYRFIGICRIDGNVASGGVDGGQPRWKGRLDVVSAELVYHKIKLFFLARTGALTEEEEEGIEWKSDGTGEE